MRDLIKALERKGEKKEGRKVSRKVEAKRISKEGFMKLLEKVRGDNFSIKERIGLHISNSEPLIKAKARLTALFGTNEWMENPAKYGLRVDTYVKADGTVAEWLCHEETEPLTAIMRIGEIEKDVEELKNYLE